MTLRLQSVQVVTGSADAEGQLVFSEGALVAVLTRLTELHEVDAGQWFLEAGFGPMAHDSAPLFADLQAAQGWISQRLPKQVA